MSDSFLFRFSVASAIIMAFAYSPILRKMSLGLVSPFPKPDMRKRIFAATVDVVLVAMALNSYRAFQLSRYLVLAIAYLLLRDSIGGRSIGKFLFGLFVIDLKTGRPCRYGAAMRRNALFLLPGANVVAAFLEASTVIRDSQGQRLGDRLALTQVVEGFGAKDFVTALQQSLANLADQLREQWGDNRVRKPDRVTIERYQGTFSWLDKMYRFCETSFYQSVDLRAEIGKLLGRHLTLAFR